MKTFKHLINGLVLVALLAGNAIAVTSTQLKNMAKRGCLVRGERRLLNEGGLQAIADMFANSGVAKKDQ